MRHPLRYSGELSSLHVPWNPNEPQDARMGHRDPENGFFVE